MAPLPSFAITLLVYNGAPLPSSSRNTSLDVTFFILQHISSLRLLRNPGNGAPEAAFASWTGCLGNSAFRWVKTTIYERLLQSLLTRDKTTVLTEAEVRRHPAPAPPLAKPLPPFPSRHLCSRTTISGTMSITGYYQSPSLADMERGSNAVALPELLGLGAIPVGTGKGVPGLIPPPGFREMSLRVNLRARWHVQIATVINKRYPFFSRI